MSGDIGNDFKNLLPMSGDIGNDFKNEKNIFYFIMQKDSKSVDIKGKELELVECEIA